MIRPPAVRLGTRSSALATTQTRQIADALDRVGVPCVLVPVRTRGDVLTGPLAVIGGTGIFVTALRDAVLSGEVDVAVHSHKDLPTAPTNGIRLAAVPRREDPADAVCARDGLRLVQLPPGARVGTGSPRRKAQLLAIRSDLAIEPIRGNVDTRLSMVHSGRLDAVVLAMAGLARLNRTSEVSEVLTTEQMLPAPAQGALAIECRNETSWFTERLGELDDPSSRAQVTAERAFLAVLEAGCIAPVGALASIDDDRMTLNGAVIAVDGSEVLRGSIEGAAADAAGVGRRLAEDLLARGAGALLGAAR